MTRSSHAARIAALLLWTTCASEARTAPDFRDLLVNRDRIRAYELLDFPDIALLAGNLLGPAYDRLERSLRTGIAITVVDDRYVIGHGCRPHDCDVARSTLAIDTKTGRILATVVDETGRTVKPPISTWPKAVAAATEWDGRLVGLAARGVPVQSRVAPGRDLVDLSTVDGRVIYDHGGSEVLIDHDRGLIVYSRPKPSLDGIVEPGQVLFRGSIPDDGRSVAGEAYVFRRGCPPAPYKVTGSFRGEAGSRTLVLRGSPPRRSESGCGIVGYRNGGPNSILEFDFLVSP